MERRRYSPSMREDRRCGRLKSVSTVSYHFKVLEQTGHLTRDAGIRATVGRSRLVLEPFSRSGPSCRALTTLAYSRPRGRPGPGPGQATLTLLRMAWTSPPNSLLCAAGGWIAAGLPILAEENIEDVFPLPRQLVGDGRCSCCGSAQLHDRRRDRRPRLVVCVSSSTLRTAKSWRP